MLMPYQRRWDLNKLLATLNHQLVCDLNHLQLNAQHIPIFIAPCGWRCFGWTNRTGHRWGNMMHADWEGQLIGCSSWTVWMGKTMLRFDWSMLRDDALWRCDISLDSIAHRSTLLRFTSSINPYNICHCSCRDARISFLTDSAASNTRFPCTWIDSCTIARIAPLKPSNLWPNLRTDDAADRPLAP